MTRISLIGAIPPPYGGVTIYLRRLLDRLQQRQFAVTLYDISGQPKIEDGVVCRRWRFVALRLLFARRAVVHFHNYHPLNLYLYALLGLRHFTVLSLHNERFAAELQARSRLQRPLLRWALNRLDRVTVVNEECAAAARGLIRRPDRIRVVSGFMMPLPSRISPPPPQFQALRDRHKYLIISNAFTLSFHNGEDLYGIDLLIELTERLAHKHQLDACTVVLLPNIGDADYYRRLRGRIAAYGLQDRFMFFTEPIDGPMSLWKLADVMVRATNTDGNSLSVLEALSCGTSVIASDCVPRHPAVIPFKSRDQGDLERATLGVLNDLANRRTALAEITIPDCADEIIAIYKEFK